MIQRQTAKHWVCEKNKVCCKYYHGHTLNNLWLKLYNTHWPDMPSPDNSTVCLLTMITKIFSVIPLVHSPYFDLDKCRLSASKKNHGGSWFYVIQLRKKVFTTWKFLCMKQSRGQCLEGVHHVKSRTHAQDHKHCELDLKGNMLAGESSARKLFTYYWVKVTRQLSEVQLCKFYFCCFSIFMPFLMGNCRYQHTCV